MHDGPRNHQAPLESAGQRFRLLISVRPETESFDQRVNALQNVRLARTVITSRLDQIPAHGKLAVVGVVLGTYTERSPSTVAVACEIMSGNADLSGIGSKKAVAHAQRRC